MNKRPSPLTTSTISLLHTLHSAANLYCLFFTPSTSVYKPTDVQAGKQSDRKAGESPGWHRLTLEDPRFWKSLHWYKKIALSGFPPMYLLSALSISLCLPPPRTHAHIRNTYRHNIQIHKRTYTCIQKSIYDCSFRRATPKLQEPNRRDSEKVNLIKTAKDRKFSRSATSLKDIAHR